MSVGGSLLEIARANIRRKGRLLTVTRGETSQGAGDGTTSSIYFLPQSLNQNSSHSPNWEGGVNAGEENAFDFVCAGDEDVVEKDLIGPFKSFYWRVENNNANPLDDSEPVLHNYTVREKKA